LKTIVNQTLSSRGSEELTQLVEEARAELGRRKSAGFDADSDTPRTTFRKLAVHRSRQVSEGNAKLQAEWEVEDDVRNMYDIEPPVEIFSEEEWQLNRATSTPLPRPSLLNRTTRLGSLRKLVTAGLGDFDPLRSFTRRGSSVPPKSVLEQIEEKYSFDDSSMPSPAAIPTNGEDSPAGQDGGLNRNQNSKIEDEESPLLGGKSNQRP
jgi:hypothetical protein